VTAYLPGPPSSPLKVAGLSQRGAHSQAIAPSGPIRAPRWPSAISEYSRSTCGRNGLVTPVLLS
jgi:hypothetical protein